MIRPPSHQKKFDLFFSRDPAIRKLPADASREQKAELARLIELAREQGTPETWDAITEPGQQLTKFTMRPLPADAYGDLASMIGRSEMPFRVWKLAFRIALREVKPLEDDVELEFEQHPHYGLIASLSFLEKTNCGGRLGANVISELGQLVFDLANNLDPKP